MRILIIDDYQDIAFMLGVIVRKWGHEVKTVNSGKEALAMVEAFEPNLILLDLGMPGMDGYETCTKLRELEALREVKIVALTGHGDEETIEQCLENGFDNHLLKPVQPKDLQEIISEIN